MKNFLCWDPSDVGEIINPDVDAIPDHIFRAIHTDFLVPIREDRNSVPEFLELDKFKERLLAPTDTSLVPVVGQSGTGKSHLIRWLKLTIPSDASREVMFVPKAQTNLRDIVTSLINRLDPVDQALYLKTLENSGDQLRNAKAQRTAVVNNLQLAIVNKAGDNLAPMPSAERDYHADGLSALFSDPYLKNESFLRDGTFAADIAEHVFEKPSRYAPVEQRREFRQEDLPLQMDDLKASARETRDYLRFLLGNKAQLDNAIAFVNRHLDWAIGQCLNFTGDQLIKLMLDIRRTLARDGKSLVLLIEDFARLQGVDRALLQSILEQRKTDRCLLQTAFACTRGFYDTIADTVRTRLSFTVDMDLTLDSETQSNISMPQLVSRYMNALRLGPTELLPTTGLDDEYGGAGQFLVANKCTDCEHRDYCHTNFGHEQGFGLYPFTPTAIDVLKERAQEQAKPDPLSLRYFQNKVLRPITEYGDRLREGQFPPFALLNHLGGVGSFPNVEQQKLEQADPTNWRRRLTSLLLWENNSKAVNLKKAVQEAFDIAWIESFASAEDYRPKRKPDTRDQPRDNPDVADIAKWLNGENRLPQQLAQRMREVIHAAIREHIDWDNIGLAPGDFFGVGKPFPVAGIYFENQTTQPSASLIQLKIPGNWKNREERALVEEALHVVLALKSKETESGNLPLERRVAWAESLSQWAKTVTAKVHAAVSASNNLVPSVIACKIRLIESLLSDTKQPKKSLQDLWVRAVTYQVEPQEFLNGELTRLFAKVQQRDELLFGLISGGLSVSKGGQKGRYFDAAAAIEDIKQFKKARFVLEHLPVKASEIRYRPIELLIILNNELAERLMPAFEREIELRKAAALDLNAAFGPGTKKDTIAAACRSLADSAGRLGIDGADAFLRSVVRFEEIHDEGLMGLLPSLNANATRSLSDVAPRISDDLDTCKALARDCADFLKRVESEVNSRLDTVELENLAAIQRETGVVLINIESAIKPLT